MTGTELLDPPDVDDETLDMEFDDEATELSPFEREHYEQIKTLEDEARSAEDQYLDAKAEAKAAKELWERKVERLRSVIRTGPDRQQHLPFADADEEPPVEAWRDTPIVDVLYLSPKQAERLEEAGIRTVGGFEDLRAGQRSEYPDGLLDLPGVGGATVDKWEEQVLDWLAENARESEPVEEPDLETDDDE